MQSQWIHCGTVCLPQHQNISRRRLSPSKGQQRKGQRVQSSFYPPSRQCDFNYTGLCLQMQVKTVASREMPLTFQKKEASEKIKKKAWRRPTLPRTSRSTIGEEAFHGRVRDGNVWDRFSMVTRRTVVLSENLWRGNGSISRKWK